MLGIKCKQCNKKFISDFILVIEGICVYCYHNTNEFYMNGDLLTRQEAIERNRKMENLVSKFKKGIK